LVCAAFTDGGHRPLLYREPTNWTCVSLEDANRSVMPAIPLLDWSKFGARTIPLAGTGLEKRAQVFDSYW